jgi:hypothetical protein
MGVLVGVWVGVRVAVAVCETVPVGVDGTVVAVVPGLVPTGEAVRVIVGCTLVRVAEGETVLCPFITRGRDKGVPSTGSPPLAAPSTSRP